MIMSVAEVEVERMSGAVGRGDPTVTLSPCHPVTLSPSAVSCRGLTKEFGKGETRVRVLRGIDLEVQAGALTLLVGPSGCGKTTLISVMAATLEPTAGEVEVLGVNLTKLSDRERGRFRGREIGFVFQQFNLLPALTARENVAVPLLIMGRPRNSALERAAEMLEAVGLGERMNNFPAQLSGGQQQRVAIARALVHEPRLLVCDEPTSALDAKSGRTVMELIRGVAVQEGRAVVVVTHDHRVYDFADRIISLSDGRIDAVQDKAAG
jgi:putative ABC transport system ATP-binding protein